MQPWQQQQQAQQAAQRAAQQAQQAAQQAQQAAWQAQQQAQQAARQRQRVRQQAKQQPVLRQQQGRLPNVPAPQSKSAVGGCVRALLWIVALLVVGYVAYALLIAHHF
ncbi:MAG TPA: hypothetical protein VFU69_16595 [Ktedonobacterales bacterium]|nr:hypothetical protein [Ktedonobacterales bacterium]